MSVQKPQPISELVYFDMVVVPQDSLRFQEEFADLSKALGAREIALNDPTRSKAFIKFTLCHSLPMVNANGACWTHATLKNSVGTVQDQLIDLNHIIGERARKNSPHSIIAGPGLSGTSDQIIGHMKFGEIADSPDDAFIPKVAIPIVATGILFKRSNTVGKVLQLLASGKPVKVSMECEFEEIAYYYDGKLYEPGESGDIDLAVRSGQRTLNGKSIARVLGGKNGVVNFHGVAILIDEAPADPQAEIKAAVASNEPLTISEFGGDMSNLEIVAVPGTEASLPLTPATFSGPEEDLTEENLKKGQAEQVKAMGALQTGLASLLDRAEQLTQKLFGRPGTRADDWHPPVLTPVADDPFPLDPNTPYADPGFLGDKIPCFPLRTREEILTAASYFSQPPNLVPYTDLQYLNIADNITMAANRNNVQMPSHLMTAKVPKVSPAQSAGATPGTTQEDIDMTTENQQASAAATAAATAAAAAATQAAESLQEQGRAMAQQVEDLRQANSQLMDELQGMRKAEAERAKKERTNMRTNMVEAKIGPMDEECSTHMMPILEHADDDTFNRHMLLLQKVHDKGVQKGKAMMGDDMSAAAVAAREAQAAGNAGNLSQQEIDNTIQDQLPTDKNFQNRQQTPAGPSTNPTQQEIDNTIPERLPTDKNFPGQGTATAATQQPAARPPVQSYAPMGAGGPDFTPEPGQRARNKFHALG